VVGMLGDCWSAGGEEEVGCLEGTGGGGGGDTGRVADLEEGKEAAGEAVSEGHGGFGECFCRWKVDGEVDRGGTEADSGKRGL